MSGHADETTPIQHEYPAVLVSGRGQRVSAASRGVTSDPRADIAQGARVALLHGYLLCPPPSVPSQALRCCYFLYHNLPPPLP